MDQFSLPDLIAFLNDQTPETLKGDAVGRFLAKCNMNEDPFIPFIYFREDTFARNLVHKSEQYELLVLTWLPGQVGPIHDHAGQRSWSVVLSGTLTFEHYARNAKKPDPLKPPKIFDVSPGSPIYIDDAIGMQSMANVSSKPAISLLLNVGPVRICTAYDPTKHEFSTIELDYFTTFDGEFGSLPLLEEPSEKLH